jgi:hypothetical protein
MTSLDEEEPRMKYAAIFSLVTLTLVGCGSADDGIDEDLMVDAPDLTSEVAPPLPNPIPNPTSLEDVIVTDTIDCRGEVVGALHKQSCANCIYGGKVWNATLSQCQAAK